MAAACGTDSTRTVRLDLGPATGGTVEVNGTNRRLPWSTTLDAGASVTLLGVPEEGYAFESWSGDHVSADNPARLVVTADTTVTPVFSRLPQLVFTPSAGEFGAVRVGTSRDVTLTVANHGGGILTGTAETRAPFSIVEGAAFRLEEGDTHNVIVRYSPTTEGASTGELRLSTASGEHTLALSGNGTVDPPVYRGFSVSVTGEGQVYSEPAGILCPDGCSSTFEVGTRLLLSVAPTSPVATPKWSSCDTPAGSRINSATCEVTLDSDRVVFVDFTPDPTLVVTPATGDFGTVHLGSSRDVVYTVANQGGGTITGTAEASAPFSVISGAAYTLGSGDSQEVVVRFTPTEVGEATGELNFTGGAGQTVLLSGNGAVAPPETTQLDLTVTGNGRVTSEPAGIDCPGECSATFTEGTEIVLTSAPASPVGHAEWTGCDAPADDGTEATTCELSLETDRAVQVDFPATPDVVVTLTPTTATLLTGESRAFTATVSGTEDTGLTWSATGGSIVGTGSTVTYTAPDVEDSYTVTATSVADPTRSAQATVTVEARRVISVAAGEEFSLALKNDGTVWAWGANGAGQLGIGTTVDSSVPVQVTGLNDIVKVVAGGSHALALQSNGYAWMWGAGSGGTLPNQVLSYSDVIDIAAGEDHSLLLRRDGRVYAWGSNLTGQLGDGTTEDRTWSSEVHLLTDIHSVSAGGDHSLAVDSQGRVYAWGMNNAGQLGVLREWDECGINYSCSTEPRLMGQWVGSVPIGGGAFSMVLTDYGGVFSTGDNGMGQLGVPSTDECAWSGDSAGYSCSLYPIRVTDLPAVSAVSAGHAHALALTSQGDVYAWGSAVDGELGVPSSDGCTTGATPIFLCSKTPLHVPTLSGAVAVAAGGNHSLAVLSNGSVWSWGANGSGQLGDGTTQTRSSPTLIHVP